MSILKTRRSEIARCVSNRRFERTEDGIYIHSMRTRIGGALKLIDYQTGHIEITPNLLTNEGLDHFLNAALPPTGGYTPITAWYVAPFSGNYTPVATLTAANFTANATEFLAYASATRPALTIAAASSAQTTGNTGAPALLVLNAGGPYNLYGGVIISAAAKSAVTGKCLAAVRFASPRLGQVGGDKLGLEYVITATSSP